VIGGGFSFSAADFFALNYLSAAKA